MRRQLVSLLTSKERFSAQVLAAMEKLPRHWFMFDKALVHRAYDDNAFPIGDGQTISQPSTVAYQTDLLQIRKMDKVLEIGTGSGYQAAILALMGARVYTIERQRNLFEKVKEIYKAALPAFPELTYVKPYFGDGFAGVPAFAPYDKILITCGAPDVPETLMAQLKTGGIMVIPVTSGDGERMTRITKSGDGTYTTEEFDLFRFVPMLKGTNNKSSL